MGTDFNSENISKLKTGETTEQEVIQLIGQPRTRMRNADGTVSLLYMYSPGQTIHMFSIYDPNFVQKSGSGRKTLMIMLDASGKFESFQESVSQ